MSDVSSRFLSINDGRKIPFISHSGTIPPDAHLNKSEFYLNRYRTTVLARNATNLFSGLNWLVSYNRISLEVSDNHLQQISCTEDKKVECNSTSSSTYKELNCLEASIASADWNKTSTSLEKPTPNPQNTLSNVRLILKIKIG